MMQLRHTAYADLASGRYLSALRRAEREFVSPEATPRSAQELAWALHALDPWGRAWMFRTPAMPAASDAMESPEEVIPGALRATRLLVIQDRHHAPETRLFGARLLPALAVAGATHFACETANPAACDHFARTGVLYHSADILAFDPARAALLRSARASGLRLAPLIAPLAGRWSSTLRSLRLRPSDPATLARQHETTLANQVATLLARDPQARLVVWACEQHAVRLPVVHDAGHTDSMASLLAARGLRPFCVAQVSVDCAAWSAAPRLLAAHHPWLAEHGADAIVMHHAGAQPARPDWIDEHTVAIELPSSGAELIQALSLSEGPESVPLYQWLTSGAESSIRIPPGRYLFRGLHGLDRELWRWTRTI